MGEPNDNALALLAYGTYPEVNGLAPPSPVPPLAVGSVPDTSVVRPTCAKLMVVPSVLRTRLAVPPEVNEGTPVELVTSAEVLAEVKPPTVFVALEYKI
jgi:hypothetical protein